MRDQAGYLNAKQAAAYVGYGVSAFRKHAREAQLPRRGPKKNRYSKADLDAFMADPRVFRSPAKIAARPREGFTPVSV